MVGRSGPLSPAFDGRGGPDPALVEDCVHCGFCLPACPTYVLWGEEMDSPRGRIQLISQGLAGEDLSAAAVEHFDRCLGCMACMTACPSGVHYDQLLSATRSQIERRWDRGPLPRMVRTVILAVASHPARLRWARRALWLHQRSGAGRLLRDRRVAALVPAALRTAESVAPPVTAEIRLPTFLAARGTRRGRVGLLTGCVQQVFFSGQRCHGTGPQCRGVRRGGSRRTGVLRGPGRARGVTPGSTPGI